MSAKWERDSDASKGTLTFEIDVDTINKGIDEAFVETRKKITVPGFRKGRVPRQIFNQMYGEESLYQDALNKVLPDAYNEAVKETNIQPVDQPKIDIKSMEKGQPWVLTAEVDVMPEVKLGLETIASPSIELLLMLMLMMHLKLSVNNKLNLY